MTDPVLILIVVVPLALGIVFGVLAGRASCRHTHPRHWDLDGELPYTPDDDGWFPIPDPPPPTVDQTRAMPTYTLPERSCLAQWNWTPPSAEQLARWAEGERL